MSVTISKTLTLTT